MTKNNKEVARILIVEDLSEEIDFYLDNIREKDFLMPSELAYHLQNAEDEKGAYLKMLQSSRFVDEDTARKNRLAIDIILSEDLRFELDEDFKVIVYIANSSQAQIYNSLLLEILKTSTFVKTIILGTRSLSYHAKGISVYHDILQVYKAGWGRNYDIDGRTSLVIKESEEEVSSFLTLMKFVEGKNHEEEVNFFIEIPVGDTLKHLEEVLSK